MWQLESYIFHDNSMQGPGFRIRIERNGARGKLNATTVLYISTLLYYHIVGLVYSLLTLFQMPFLYCILFLFVQHLQITNKFLCIFFLYILL